MEHGQITTVLEGLFWRFYLWFTSSCAYSLYPLRFVPQLTAHERLSKSLSHFILSFFEKPAWEVHISCSPEKYYFYNIGMFLLTLLSSESSSSIAAA
jgi:hypothetical protein